MGKNVFTVSLVGRPNVGKSTLFNRITGKRRSITYGEPGVTRDLVSLEAEHDGKRFRLIDTGGYLSGERGDILLKVRGQVLRAVYESDAVIFLVDARDGVLPLDKEIAAMLREKEKRFFLAANKVDTREGQEMAAQFHELSVGTVYPISAEHGTGVSDLLDAIVPLIPDFVPEDDTVEEPVARIAVLGRPNVGKSTLINTLVGYDRVIASEIPGTTRDAVDVLVTYGGKTYQFIDTAGIRAKRKTETVLEKFSVLKSLDSLKRCDLAVLMIDGPQGLTHQDQQILRYILLEERAVVVAVNKADLWAGEEERRQGIRKIGEGLGYASFAAVVPTVSTTGKGIPLLIKKIEEAYGSFRNRISTSSLNRKVSTLLSSLPIPTRRGRNRAFYITQVGVMPPSFAVFVKDRQGVPESYTRYLQNNLRDRFGFQGSPIRIVYRER
ncbi:MAG TPA: ribosome biogenesis GTPase Der [Candidatus Deferrimicrobiaceae bacterium]|nr:ribosome biogenesis GTPase Der [Candidatus Deferrimicrobiaceae bacterium]